ncbi:MAG: lipoate protein ligase C-terminal domain-containing protein [bacterium]
MKNWRLIIDDGVSASFGLAADKTLANRVGDGLSPPTLRLYSYRSHCALAGRFQNIDNEIQVDYCQENDVQINRRPTGGGAIIMGGEQLGVALMIPNNLSIIPSWEGQGWVKNNANPSDPTWSPDHVLGSRNTQSGDCVGSAQRGRSINSTRELMRYFSAGLIAALNSLGITAAFQRKNDLEVNGKKIAGLGIYRDPSGGLLFHASLLVDLDIALMLKILKTPFEKISDKEIETVAKRITTVRKESGEQVSLDRVRRKVADGYANVFDVALTEQDFSRDEREEIAKLEREKYLTQEWIFQTTEVPDAFGSARKKTLAGLLDVRLALSGRIIKAAYLRGDFFISESTVAEIEAALKWLASEPVEIEKTLRTIYQKHAAELDGLPMRTLQSVILAAVENASAQNTQEKKPYGCFVKPSGRIA